MIDLTPVLLIAAALVLGWLVATWYFADDEPVIGKATRDRVTFKDVLVGVGRDVRDLASPVTGFLHRRWRFVMANYSAGAIVLLDVYAVMDANLRDALMQVPPGWAVAPAALILFGLNLAARMNRGAPA